MDRRKFLSQVGLGASALLVPTCIGGLASCSGEDVVPSAPTNVDFAVDISSGSLSNNGGFMVSDGIIIARTNSGTFLAVSAACTHQGTTVDYYGANNNFVCPNHGAEYNNSGTVIKGPAAKDLTQYNTSLSGTSLRIFS